MRSKVVRSDRTKREKNETKVNFAGKLDIMNMSHVDREVADTELYVMVSA